MKTNLFLFIAMLGFAGLLSGCDRHNTVHMPGGVKVESSPGGHKPGHCPPGHAKKGWC